MRMDSTRRRGDNPATPTGNPCVHDDLQLQQLRPRVMAAVRRACPGWAPADVDDLVQNMMAALVRRMESSEGNRTFSSIYLEKMAYGVLVDELRRRERRREVSLEDAALERVAGAAASPARAFEGSEIARGIRECVSALVPPRRRAVALYLLGCGVPEVARRSGWAVKRAENLVYRGLADVRSCLETKGIAP